MQLLHDSFNLRLQFCLPDSLPCLPTQMGFYLNKKASGHYVYLSHAAGDGPVEMSTGLKVDKDLFKADKLSKSDKAYLRRIAAAIDEYEGACRHSGAHVQAGEIRRIVLEVTGRKAIAKRGSGKPFLAYYGAFLDDVTAGNILNKGEHYSKAYIRIAEVVGRLLPAMALSAIPVEQITETDLSAYAAELSGRGLTKNTVATYLDPVLSFLIIGRRLKRHFGPVLDTRAFRISREDVDHHVYLTTADQDKIAALDYTGNDAAWRDAFLLGCQLGMRHSDLVRLGPEHYRDGMVNINTQKTNVPVYVPLNALARSLWERYGGNFSVPDKDRLLQFAKKLGRDAGLKEKVLFSRTEGGRKIERWIEKCELLGTHSMRRSAATNMYKAGVDIYSIMKITGHRSTSSFLKYIRLSDAEHAQHMKGHEYFR